MMIKTVRILFMFTGIFLNFSDGRRQRLATVGGGNGEGGSLAARRPYGLNEVKG